MVNLFYFWGGWPLQGGLIGQRRVYEDPGRDNEFSHFRIHPEEGPIALIQVLPGGESSFDPAIALDLAYHSQHETLDMDSHWWDVVARVESRKNPKLGQFEKKSTKLNTPYVDNVSLEPPVNDPKEILSGGRVEVDKVVHLTPVEAWTWRSTQHCRVTNLFFLSPQPRKWMIWTEKVEKTTWKQSLIDPNRRRKESESKGEPWEKVYSNGIVITLYLL